MIKLIRNTLLVAALVFVALSVAVYAEEVSAPDSAIVQTVAKHASCLTWANFGRLPAKAHWGVLNAVPVTYKYYKLYYSSLSEGFLVGYAKAKYEANPKTALINFGGNYQAFLEHTARNIYAVNCKQEM